MRSNVTRWVTSAALAAACAAASAHAQNGSLEITLKHGSKGEAQTRDQLQRLLKSYDVSRWIYTRSIIIDEQAIPYSHPVLTLSARHVQDDELLLSTFVHEQFHWPLVQKGKETEEAIKELHGLFPTVPTAGPEGANGERSTYLHLIVCYLEWRADQQLLGELKARQVMDFWATDHYRWVYRTVLERPGEIATIVTRHGLMQTF
ncbi:MAG TPA: hypothetical protein VNG89_25800 [Vicinamibacterales bacterium]|nr:hypothetical protein [Vicinamibacterales bacterium]